MARSKINKAAKIREMFEKLGLEARPKDVISELAAAKIEVSSAQVSNVKATLGGANRRSNKSAALSINDLVLAKKFVDALGSVERAEGALTALSKLQ